MELEQTEQEQVEALQKWWRENWLTLIGGLLLGLAGILGWQYYGEAQKANAAQASLAYEAIRDQLAAEQVEAAIAAAGALAQSHADSPYVGQAYLAIAAKQAEAGQWAGAETALRSAQSDKQDEAMGGLIALRLARVLWAQDKTAEALALLAEPVDAYAPLYHELRGDIALSQSDQEQARDAYTQALAQDADYLNRDAIQRKLDALN